MSRAPMRLIDRYVCREVVSHSLLGLAVFTFVFFVPQLVRLMELVVRHNSGFGTVMLLFACIIPPVLSFTLPMAVLVGVLIGLGRLSADSEIVALHASGISLRRLLVPIGFVAFVAALITLANSFWISPAAWRTLDRVEAKLVASEAPYAVQPRVFDERFPRLVLYVEDMEAAATHWSGVFLASQGVPLPGSSGRAIDAGNLSVITVAKDAQLIPDAGGVELHLGAGSEHEYDPRYPDRYNVTTFGESDIPIQLSIRNAQAASLPLTTAEKASSALLEDRGPHWLDSRVEFQRRIAFPAACLVFALLGIPIGVRPRRGGRAAGLILALVLIGGYYFLFVYGTHTAIQGRIAPWLGVWLANIVGLAGGIALLARIESVRRPSRLWTRLESMWPVRNASSPAANGGNGGAHAGNGFAAKAQPAADFRRIVRRAPLAFPNLVDIYLLQQFFYYFFVMLAGFVLIFDAFTLFDLLADIARNHIDTLTVLNYFRFLAPLTVYQLAPLAILVATLVTLALLAKNNEVTAFKASGISLYRLVLPLLLAGCLVAGGMFLLDDSFLPYANQRQDALRNLIKGRPAQTYSQPSRQWIFGENSKLYNYELFDPDRQLFGGLNVFELDPASFEIKRRIFAERALWDSSQNTWILTQGWVRDFGANGKIVRYEPFAAFSLPELTEPPSYFRREVRQYYQMNWRELGNYIGRLKQAGFNTAQLSVEWQKKFAFPIIAAVIIFLGAPFAFLVGTRGAIGGLALGVGIGIVYWSTAALFEAMGSVGQLPALLSGWAPDAVFCLLGAYFFLKMPT